MPRPAAESMRRVPGKRGTGILPVNEPPFQQTMYAVRFVQGGSLRAAVRHRRDAGETPVLPFS